MIELTGYLAAVASGCSSGLPDLSYPSGHAGLVFNEIRGFCGDGSDCDFVELFNAGPAPIDLTSYALADADANTLTSAEPRPRTELAVIFTDGPTLAPGDFLHVQLSLEGAALPGLHDTCLGPPPCYSASWGISVHRGDVVFLLEPDGTIAMAERYVAGAVELGALSIGRIPDGTGAFAPNEPTPGRPNVAYVGELCVEVCRYDGRCTLADTYCVATSDEDCASSEACAATGKCAAVEGECRPTSPAHCEASTWCTDHGFCTLVDGACVP